MRYETVSKIGGAFIILAAAAAVFVVIQLGRPSGSGWVILDRYDFVIENRESHDVDVLVHDVLGGTHGFRIPAASWASLPTNTQWSDIQRVDETCLFCGVAGLRWGPQSTRVVVLSDGDLWEYEHGQPTIPPTVSAIQTSPEPSDSR